MVSFSGSKVGEVFSLGMEVKGDFKTFVYFIGLFYKKTVVMGSVVNRLRY